MGNGLPIYLTLDLKTSKGWWVQSQLGAGETPINLLPMSLTCAMPITCQVGFIFCALKKNQKANMMKKH
jgi:hypothetical protein